MLFIQRFVDIARTCPEVTAIVDVSSKLSYGELYDQAKRVAAVISSTSSGSMIGVLMGKSVDYIVSILAIHLLGRTVVPLDRNYPVERLRQMITSIDLSLCLLNEQECVELTEMLDELTRSLRIDDPAVPSVGTGSVEITPAILDEVPAYLVFTSGTTGHPKPVMVPYRSLSTLIDWMVEVPSQAGTTLLYAAQGFDVSFQEIYSSLCHGDRLLVVTDEQKKDLHELTREMVSAAVTRLFLPTSMLIPFVTFNLHDSQVLADLREVICAGEQLKICPVVRRWFKAHPQCLLINHYGPAETHVVMEYRLGGEPEDWPDLPPIGQVTQASTAYLLDDELQPVIPGAHGQLYIAGRSLALGYYGMSAQTAEKFVTHPQTHERMYNTGDICVLNEQALFEYKGRRDRQYKVRGYRVELKEIETVVADSELVDDCLVVDNQKAGVQTCGGLWLLDSPRVFTVAELLKLMMGLSDNVAAFYLVDLLRLERLNALSTVLGLAGTWHLSAVPSQALTANHPLSAVNTTTASDLVTALSILVEGANNRLPAGGAFIRRELCEFGLNSMRAQQDTTAIRSWLTDVDQVGDKHGIGYRNYNNVAYLAHGGAARIIFSIIVDDLHLVESPMPAFAHARDFIALFSRLLNDYTRLEYPAKEL